MEGYVISIKNKEDRYVSSMPGSSIAPRLSDIRNAIIFNDLEEVKFAIDTLSKPCYIEQKYKIKKVIITVEEIGSFRTQAAEGLKLGDLNIEFGKKE